MIISSIRQLASLLGSTTSVDAPIAGFAVDSRLLSKNQVFFALPGAKVDGHIFLSQASAIGASAAVVSTDYQGESYGLPLIRCKDPLASLQELTKNILNARQVKIVAITGSVGKTTTKDFVTTILQERFRVGATPGNSNSQIGIPLAILNHTTGHEEVLVIEMGMTHPGNLTSLIQIAPPNIAIITSVGLVHACNFTSLREIALAKAEILGHKKTELGIISREIENFDEMDAIGTCRKLSFSVGSRCANFCLHTNGSDVDLHVVNEEKTINLGPFLVPGKHNRQNLLAAIACARSLGLSWEEIKAAIPKLSLPERRLEIQQKRGVTFVNDSYNASALSVKAALDALPSPQLGGKRIAVLGEMLELGSFSEMCHRDVAEAALTSVDCMFCLGKECAPIVERWQQAQRPVEWFFDRKELTQALEKHLVPGDVVLLKGSRANNLWKVLEEII